MRRLISTIITVMLLSFLLSLPVFASPALSETNLLAVAPDGKTIFAYFNTGSRWLSRSTNLGQTWTTTNLGGSLNGLPLVALAVSPLYPSDMTVVAATSTRIYRSTNGGATFGSMPAHTLEGNITSLVVGPAGGQSILIGTSTNSRKGGIAGFSGSSWTSLNIGAKDVYAVAFSPFFSNDHEILALTYTGGAVQLETTTSEGKSWNGDFPAARLYSGETLTFQSAAMAFPADYDLLENNRVFVGVNGSGTGPDLYRVSLSRSGSTVTDLDVKGAKTSCNIHSVTVQGTISSGYIAAGQAESNIVKWATQLGGSTIKWNDSSRPPEGDANVELEYSPNANNLFAISTGKGYGTFLSTDYGRTFLPIPPPDTSLPAAITDLRVSGATTSSISLAWTAPGDDGNAGTASQYDIRYLEGSQITANNWNSASQATGEPAPKVVNSAETFTVSGLQPGKTYYFALKTADEAPNWSGLSNSASGTTASPPTTTVPSPTTTTVPPPTTTVPPPTTTVPPPTTTTPPPTTTTLAPTTAAPPPTTAAPPPTTTTPQAGPKFAVTDLTIAKDKASPGEKVKVIATVANTGDQTGDYTARFVINGEVEASKTVPTLAPGSRDTVQFEFARDTVASYNLQIGEKAATVTVAKGGISWIKIILAILILLAIIYILRKLLKWGFKKE